MLYYKNDNNINVSLVVDDSEIRVTNGLMVCTMNDMYKYIISESKEDTLVRKMIEKYVCKINNGIFIHSIGIDTVLNLYSALEKYPNTSVSDIFMYELLIHGLDYVNDINYMKRIMKKLCRRMSKR